MPEAQKIPLHFRQTLAEVRSCTLCAANLPLGPRPVLSANPSARLLIVGQAPGTRVHETGIPWNDPSGDRLRQWLGLDREQFYDQRRVAIVPMGFCYPGRGTSGDLPPRPECAPQWHQRILCQLPDIQLTLLIGQYAQRYYLDRRYKTLTDRVKAWREYNPQYFPLVHPSPRNTYWLQRNPWFELELVPQLQHRVKRLMNN